MQDFIILHQDEYNILSRGEMGFRPGSSCLHKSAGMLKYKIKKIPIPCCGREGKELDYENRICASRTPGLPKGLSDNP